MDLLGYCRRKCTYHPCLFQAFDTFLNTECGGSIRYDDMDEHQGQYYSQFYVDLDHTQHLGTHSWQLCE
jgi:hypothetical protein